MQWSARIGVKLNNKTLKVTVQSSRNWSDDQIATVSSIESSRVAVSVSHGLCKWLIYVLHAYVLFSGACIWTPLLVNNLQI